MSVFIVAYRDTAKLYVQFLDQNNPKSKHWCKNELTCLRDFEAVQETHSCVLSDLKTRGEAESF